MKPTIYAVCIIAVVLALMWIEAARRRNTNTSRPLSPEIITEDLVRGIQPDTSIEALKARFGQPAMVVGGVSPQTGKKSYTYDWIDRHNNVLKVTSQNDINTSVMVIPSLEWKASSRPRQLIRQDSAP